MGLEWGKPIPSVRLVKLSLLNQYHKPMKYGSYKPLRGGGFGLYKFFKKKKKKEKHIVGRKKN